MDTALVFKERQHAPFRPACFSPCAPKPKPFGLDAPADFPPKIEEWKVGELRFPVCIGRAPASFALQARMLRFDFACSRKIRPSMISKQPTEKRKNAETSVKPSTWWERIVAPMLRWSFKPW